MTQKCRVADLLLSFCYSLLRSTPVSTLALAIISPLSLCYSCFLAMACLVVFVYVRMCVCVCVCFFLLLCFCLGLICIGCLHTFSLEGNSALCLSQRCKVPPSLPPTKAKVKRTGRTLPLLSSSATSMQHRGKKKKVELLCDYCDVANPHSPHVSYLISLFKCFACTLFLFFCC